MWHFRNDESEFSYNPFKKKSKFDPKRKDAAIESYFSLLKEEISSLDYKIGYSNLTKGEYSNLTQGERDAICSLKNDNSIIIEEPDEGSPVVFWDRENYLKEAKNERNDKNVYKEFTGNVEGPLEKIIKTVLKKVRNISDNTLGCFLVNNPNLGRFTCYPKSIRGFRMCQGDMLYPIQDIRQIYY